MIARYPKRLSLARILLHALFILVGVGTTMYGPLLPALSRRWQMGDGGAGLLFGAVFLCAVLSALMVTVLLRRFRGWTLMLWGFVLVGSGALGLSGGVWLAGFVGSCLLGFGLGMVNPTANLAAAAMWPGRTGSALTLLNLFFSVGAMGAPPLIGWCVEKGWAAWFPVGFGIITLLGAFVAARMEGPEGSREPNRETARTEDAPTDAGWRRLAPFAGASMALLFLYVGVEVSLGGWATTYLLRTASAGAMLAASAPSAFWGAILLSRLISIAILPRVGMLPVLVAGSGLALAGSAWMLLPETPWVVLAAVALAGFGLGPVFPNGVGYFLQHGGPGATRITGVVFASGSVGGAVLPMMIGQVSEQTGNLPLAMAIIPVGAALLLAAVGLTAWLRPDRVRQEGSAPAS